MHVLKMELIQAADLCVDEWHDKFASLGQRFFGQFGSDRKKVSTQIRNLQQIACSATCFADIEDFVRNQMDKGDKKWMAVGNDMLKQLSQLRDCSERIAEKADDRMAVRLRLARGWVWAVVSAGGAAMHVLKMELIQAADRCVDERHDKFASLGQRFFDQFGSDRKKVSTQIRNLQQIACSATCFADIEDFVRNQMDKGDKKWMAVGNDMLKQLSQLRDCSERIAEKADDRMAVRLRLARGWVRAVVSAGGAALHMSNTGLIEAADRCVDERHDEFASLGQRFFEQFGSDRGKVSTQVRNLQQITCSATRFADIEDFVKNQMGKKGNQNWGAVGNDVLKQLSQLRNHSEKIAEKTDDRMAVRLRLARGWVRAVVGEYLYRLAQQQMKASA